MTEYELGVENEHLRGEIQRLGVQLLKKDNEISNLTDKNVLLRDANRLANELLESKDEIIRFLKKGLGVNV